MSPGKVNLGKSSVQITANRMASTSSSGAITKKLQQHDAAYKVLMRTSFSLQEACTLSPLLPLGTAVTISFPSMCLFVHVPDKFR